MFTHVCMLLCTCVGAHAHLCVHVYVQWILQCTYSALLTGTPIASTWYCAACEKATSQGSCLTQGHAPYSEVAGTH